MADPIFHDYDIVVSAEWLQDKLKEREHLERAVINLNKHIDLLETKIALIDFDYPQYKLNVRG